MTSRSLVMVGILVVTLVATKWGIVKEQILRGKNKEFYFGNKLRILWQPSGQGQQQGCEPGGQESGQGCILRFISCLYSH